MWNESQSLIMEAFNGNGSFGFAADRRSLVPEPRARRVLRHQRQRARHVVHQREVRRPDHARSRPALDRHDPERLRAPRHRLADAAWPPHSIAAAVPEHRQPAPGGEHDVHAVEHAGDDPAAFRQRARARRVRQLSQADGLDRVRLRELRRMGTLPDHRQRDARSTAARPSTGTHRGRTTLSKAFQGRAASATCWPRATT